LRGQEEGAQEEKVVGGWRRARSGGREKEAADERGMDADLEGTGRRLTGREGGRGLETGKLRVMREGEGSRG
jgi:hypothetical protein